MDSKILERIQKLLNLSQSDNAHEAASALAMAQKLMESHGVDQLDLQLSNITEIEVETTSSVSKIKPHESILMQNLAEVFGCSLLWQSGGWKTSGRFVIVGLKDQAKLCEYSCVLLLRRMKKARAEYSSKLSQKGYIGREKTAELDTYCRGWARSATSKAAELSVKSKETAELIAKYKSRLDLNKDDAKESSKRLGSYSSLATGIAHGAAEDVNRPMGEAHRQRVSQTLQISHKE